MPIFKIEKEKAKRLKLVPMLKEKNLQRLIEQNLMEILEMHLLETEYSTTSGGRIDTLAVDISGAPVIIEYKLSQNENVINQALSYLKWLKAQKVEFFEGLIRKKKGHEFADKFKIDWSNPRVICIAENYSKFDIDTVESVSTRLELFRYRFYDDGILNLESLNTVDQSASKSSKKTDKSSSGGSYDIDEVKSKGNLQIQSLFDNLRDRVLRIDEEIIEKTTKTYIAYRLSRNFAEINFSKDKMTIYLRPIKYNDPHKMVEKISDSYKWILDKRVYLKDTSELDYIMSLIEQSYNDVV